MHKQETLDNALAKFNQCFLEVFHLHTTAIKNPQTIELLRTSIERIGITYNPTYIAKRNNMTDVINDYHSNQAFSNFVNRLFFKWRSRLTTESYQVVLENLVEATTMLRDTREEMSFMPPALKSSMLTVEDMRTVLQNNPALVVIYLIASIPDALELATELVRQKVNTTNTKVVVHG